MERKKSLRRDLVFLWILLSAGCGQAIQGDRAPKRIASGCPDQSAGVAKPARAVDVAPHRFTPHSHPPHSRVSYQGAKPDLNALPRLSMRLGKCFPRYQRAESQIAVGSTPSTSGAGAIATSPRTSIGRSRVSPKKAAMPSGAQPVVSQAQPSQAPVEKKTKLEAEAAAETSADVLAAPSADDNRRQAQIAESAGPEKALSQEPGEAPSQPPCESALIAGPEIEQEEDKWSKYEDWGAEIYLSNDDTMSLSSAQRVIYAIDSFLPLPVEHIRPHELLNYFSFETLPPRENDDFSVLADIAPEPREEGIYTLALSVTGRKVNRESRRNVALTLVVDRSGSMEDEGRMSYLKQGLSRMVDELKTGDIVHMVLFDHEVCVPMENFVVGRDPRAKLDQAIAAIEPRGSTDLHQGLTRGYEIADHAYQPGYSNRVILITDALANTGVTDSQMISTVSKYYDSRRIRISGVGVGREFNDELLDRITEKGKGAYVFLGSSAEVDAVFGSRFISLIETAALDVHFLLHLPDSLRMNVFYGEESSTVKEDVQAIHYFANTTQLFLSDLMARNGEIRPQDDIMMTIEYEDPETGEDLFEEYAFNLGEIQKEAYNVKKGRLIMTWINMLAEMATRPAPSTYSSAAGSWADASGWQACEEGRQELARLAKGLENDAETRRVVELWEKYCTRYERPRNPIKRERVAPGDSWPSAKPESPRPVE